MPLDEENPSEYFYDKRRFNEGRPEGNFDQFYKELDSLLEEFGKAADDRRHSSVAYIPSAVSVPQLIRKVCLVNNRQSISDLLFSKYVHLFTSLIIGQDLWHVWV